MMNQRTQNVIIKKLEFTAFSEYSHRLRVSEFESLRNTVSLSLSLCIIHRERAVAPRVDVVMSLSAHPMLLNPGPTLQRGSV